MPEQNYDAIVVGGGPAGATFARRMTEAGKKVVLIDKAEFPRVKICAGWITPAIWDYIAKDPVDYPGELTIQDMDRGYVNIGGKYYSTVFDGVVSYGIIRKEFDNWLLDLAKESGCEIHTGCNIDSIQRRSDSVTVNTKAGKFTAPVIIGAGGNGCPVLKKFSYKYNKEEYIIATESETFIGEDTLKNLTPYLGAMELFGEDDFWGYAWYVTKGGFLNIGIGRYKHKTDNLKTYLNQFMDKLRSMGRLDGIEDKLDKFGRHAYTLYDAYPRGIVGDNFMLIGDAGGFASRWAGEGIKPAVQSAVWAAETLLTGNPDYSAAGLAAYKTKCDNEFGEQKITMADRIINKTPDVVKAAAGRSLCRLPYTRRKFIFETAFGFELTEKSSGRTNAQPMLSGGVS